MQMNIIVQLLDYWFEPSRRPFPTKQDLAKRIGVTEKTFRTMSGSWEKAGLIHRVQRKTAAGDWNSNIYNLDGLILKVQAMEPEFAGRPSKIGAKNYPARMPRAETVPGCTEPM